jgi:hypothetical protein
MILLYGLYLSEISSERDAYVTYNILKVIVTRSGLG